jgi:hypothetical protein
MLLNAFKETEDFGACLDEQASALNGHISKWSKSSTGVWGVTRKALNIFLLEAVTRSKLARHYKLQRHEASMEVPLDSTVARGLICDATRLEIPVPLVWTRLRDVDHELNAKYQTLARRVAAKRKVHRYQLDFFYYR